MADNFVTNPAAGGDTFAADDIAGVKWQRVKLGTGADGVANDVAAGISDGIAPSTVPASGVYIYDRAASTWYRQQDAGVDGGPTANSALVTPGLYNGSTIDRQRGNTEGVALASAARTTTTQSELLTNHNARGMIVYLQVTSAPANTETLTVYLSAWYPDSSAFAYVATGMIITGNEGPKMIAAMYAPGLATSADVIDASTGSRFRKTYNMIVPRSVFVTVFHSAGSSWTYSVNYSLTV